MKKHNSKIVVLRTSLALSMLVGAGLHADQTLAAEQPTDAAQENPSSLATSEEDSSSVDETLEDEKVKKESAEESKTQDSLEKVKPEDEDLEVSETFPESKLEESQNSEDLHNDEASLTDEGETLDSSEEELETDEDGSIEEATETNDEFTVTEEADATTEEETLEEEAVIGEAEASKTVDEEDKTEKEETPSSMTMATSSDNTDDLIEVDRLYGQNRFSNAVAISQKGWETAPKVFLANGNKYTDALTGSPLAALNNSPILLTRANNLPEVTLAELNRLNTKEVVILGGELSVSQEIVNLLKQNGFTVTRIGGNNRYTQAELVANEIMKVEGRNRDAFLASGEVFSDALSIATVASNKRLPIFLTRGNRLEQSVLNAVPYVNSWTIIGGELTISKAVENELRNAGAKVKRIAGQNRYEVNRNVLNYYGTPEDHMYVTSGEHYSDTLPASVLASKENSGVLLVRNNREKTIEEQQFFAQNKHGIKDFTFIGGPLTLSEQTKKDFETPIRTVDEDLLEIINDQFDEYTLSQYNIRLIDALDMQMAVNPQTDKRYSAFISKDFVDRRTNTVTADVLNVRSGAGVNNHITAQLKKGEKVTIINEVGNWYEIDLNQMWLNADRTDVEYYLNPNNFILSETQKFQFLDLSKPSNVTAGQLNTFLKGKGILEGTGQAFIDAGKEHGVNEIYLLSHALLETGNGTSDLATGIVVDGVKVHNMFGIGAVDSNPIGGGSRRAYEQGWTTPEKAIIGGAAFIGNNYVKAGQNTLYKMRWNPDAMETYGKASHQYATDIGWAYKQVNTISNLYDAIGITARRLDIPVYLA